MVTNKSYFTAKSKSTENKTKYSLVHICLASSSPPSSPPSPPSPPSPSSFLGGSSHLQSKTMASFVSTDCILPIGFVRGQDGSCAPTSILHLHNAPKSLSPISFSFSLRGGIPNPFYPFGCCSYSWSTMNLISWFLFNSLLSFFSFRN